MEELLNILKKVNPNIDFGSEDNLVDSGVLDSLDIVEIIDAISRYFKIELDGDDIDPENFASASQIWKMIESHRQNKL